TETNMAGKIKHYVKSALRQAKADPLFTAIYIAGVTLAIATTLTMAMLYYIKIADIYPEVNRDKTYYLNRISIKTKSFTMNGSASIYFLDEYVKPIEGVIDAGVYYDSYDDASVQISEDRGDIPAKVKLVDNGFFDVVCFNFLQGEPFTREDIDGEVKDVIITDELAELVFGKGETDFVGKMISIDFQDYRVKGVVESASPLTNVSFSQIYMPAAVKSTSAFYVRDGANSSEWQKINGSYKCILLIDAGNVDAVNERLQEQIKIIERKSNSGSDGEVTLEFIPLQSHAMSVVAGSDNYEVETWWEALKGNIVVILVVLLVPAMNLGGLITGRMDARVGELGVRKAFGASRGSIYGQVLSENLVYTFIGGAIGLLASVIIVITGRMALMKMIDSSLNTILVESASVTYRPEMFLSWTVFGVAIVVCVVLNVASAMIPAWVSMHRPIVESLNEKR
ncbi:MAG: ABC transporter permease, partial [Muribaculaceae bacterium]|nr:ABC transporter permease [Muribaculaceae bacterium]